MYVDGFQRKPSDDEKDQKINDFFSRDKDEPTEKTQPPQEPLITEHSKDVLAHWRAPEFEVYEKDKKWYTYISIILVAIIAYATITNSPIMAITFILIGVVGYIYLNKEPRVLNFLVTYDGIIAENEIYEFDNIRSFWIFYEPPHTKVISLHLKGTLLPYVHIPVHDEDPVEIRRILMEHIPEVKQETNAVDTLERLLRI